MEKICKKFCDQGSNTRRHNSKLENEGSQNVQKYEVKTKAGRVE
jgi:hypothetical protein